MILSILADSDLASRLYTDQQVSAAQEELPVSVFCPMEVHVSTSCSLCLSSVLCRSMSPCVCLLSIAGPCLHLMFRVGSLSLPNYQLLPANFLYISVYFYIFLYFLYFSVFFCSLCIACQFPDKDKMHRIKNILSSQLCLMTEHWRGSNLPNIYTVQYVTIANHQQKNANTPKCQISSNSGGSRAAVACRQFTRLSTKLPSLTGYNGLYLLSSGVIYRLGQGVDWFVRVYCSFLPSYLPSFRLVVPIIAGRSSLSNVLEIFMFTASNCWNNFQF